MKYRILLLLLFVIASFATASHEVEHIKKHHDATSCQICIVSHQLLCDDIIALFEEPQKIHFGKVVLQTRKIYTHKALFHCNNRAPPLLS
jgi:hypothetical protein